MVAVDSFLMGYILFGLVLIRCSGLVVFAPFFGAEHFPAPARIGMALFFAGVLYASVTPRAVLPPVLNVSDLGLLALQELAIGLVLGFISSIIFMGAQLAGELISQQIGFSLANIIDPLFEQEIPILGFLKINLAIMLFLLANLHLLVILVLQKSFEHIAIGALPFSDGIASWPLNEEANYQATRMFVVALQLSMPVLLVMLLETVVEGFITRTMPQMNILVLGLPLRVALGTLALLFVMPAICKALVDARDPGAGILGTMVQDLDVVMRVLKG